MSQRNLKTFRERKIPNFTRLSNKKQTKQNEPFSHGKQFVVKNKRVTSLVGQSNNRVTTEEGKKQEKFKGILQKKTHALKLLDEKKKILLQEPKKQTNKIKTQIFQNINKFHILINNRENDRQKAIAFIKRKKKDCEKSQEKEIKGFNDTNLCQSITIDEKTTGPRYFNRYSFTNNTNFKSIAQNGGQNKCASIHNSKSKRKKINQCKTRRIKWGGTNNFDPQVSAIKQKQSVKQDPPCQSLRQLYNQFLM